MSALTGLGAEAGGTGDSARDGSTAWAAAEPPGGSGHRVEELYQQFGGTCLAVARKITGDHHLAQDVVQEVFLAFWRRPAGYDSARGAMRPWLLAVTHHKAVDAVRHCERRRTLGATEQDLADLITPGAALEEQVLDRLGAELVREALCALPDPLRQILVLAYFGGYSQSEIAALTSTPLGTVKTRTRTALRQLADSLPQRVP